MLFFLFFHEHKNKKLNNFIYISEGVNFRVLHGESNKICSWDENNNNLQPPMICVYQLAAFTRWIRNDH